MKAAFDFGNLVYVILTVAFLIIGAIGKRKKPVTRVPDEYQGRDETQGSIKSQFQELLKEFNPTAEIITNQEYSFSPKESVEEGPALDVVPELTTESVLDIVPAAEQPIDSNIDYRDQAQSSLDITGLDEGEPVFNYGKDHNLLIYNTITKEYNSTLTEDEELLAEIVDGFDARTAFVYSEIFKRKEF
jgi:hypothetical protein